MTANSTSGKPETPPNSISVKCCATVLAPADTICITLYVPGEGMLTEDAARNAKSKSEEVKGALTKAFPKLKQIDVVSVKLGEKTFRGYRPEENQTPRPEAVYRLAITLGTSVAQDVPKIIDTALRAGAVSPAN